MKNLGSIILGFIIGAVLTYFFCPRESDDMQHTIEAEVVKPKGVISVKDAQALNDNWTKFRKPILDSITERRAGKEDNRWAWWSLKDIEDYIAFTKVGAKKAGEDFTGLRMYFGVYGENESNKKNLSTVFIVPTGKKKVNKSSMLNINLQNDDDDDLGRPPLNEGNGGPNGYPQ